MPITIMANKESRLINAAKRTIRAEATLVIVVVVIVSWSIFGLYKLATGSDTIFGLTFTKSSSSSSSSSSSPSQSKQDQVVNQSQQELLRGVLNEELKLAPNDNLYQPQHPQLDAEAKYRQHLIQQLLAGQRELNANLGQHQADYQQQQPRMYLQQPFNRLTLAPDYMDSSRQQRLPTSNQQYRSHLLNTNHPMTASQWVAANRAQQHQQQQQNHTNRYGIRPPPPRPESQQEYQEEPMRDNEVSSMMVGANDREAAESSRDPSEQVVETGDESASPPPPPPSQVSATADTNQEDQDDAGDHESPQSSSQAPDGGGQDDAGESQEDGQQQQSSSSSSSDQPDQSAGEEPTAAGEETAREEARDIDEEVDRMSQPSSGVATHQQVKGFDYKNTVQFDDTLAPGTASNKVASSRPGNGIARFVSPSTSTTPTPAIATNKTRPARNDRPKDLQMDQNAPAPVNGNGEILNSAEDKSSRRKRSMQVIRSPYELGAFLDRLDFDPLISESSSPSAAAAAAANYNLKHQNYTSLLPGYLTSNDTVLRELLGQKQLFDALKHSQLPAPASRNPPQTTNGVPVSTDSSSSALLQLDPKTSGSLNHLNRLLEEAANEEQETRKKRRKKKQQAWLREQISKKRRRHEEMMARKKMAIGLERGGHKKRKRNKEEKKFLKEKRFKGAKKGKKVTKGRGGAGGKKGQKLYKDRGYKKKGFKNVAHKEEWGHKKSYFDEFRDKDFKKKWKKYDDKYNYAQMKKFQAKDEKGAKRLKQHDEKFKKFDNGKWKKSYQKHSKEHQQSSNRKKGHKKKSEGSYE